MKELIYLVIAVIVHELGHYFAYWRISKKRPKVKLYKFGVVSVENKDGEGEISLKDKTLILLYGVLLGFLVVLLLTDPIIILIYLLGSSYDICIIFSLISAREEYSLSWDDFIKDIPCERCRSIKEETKRRRNDRKVFKE